MGRSTSDGDPAFPRTRLRRRQHHPPPMVVHPFAGVRDRSAGGSDALERITLATHPLPVSHA